METRKIVAAQYARFFGSLLTIYGLGAAAGGDISFTTNSSDYGKIRFGNTVIDPMAGMAQVTTFMGRVISGESTNKNGVTTPLRGDFVKYGGNDMAGVIGRFLRTKIAPIPGEVLNQLTGKDVGGNKVTPADLPANLLMPLSFRDIYESMQEQGIEKGTAISLLAIFGMGVQNQKPSVK